MMDQSMTNHPSQGLPPPMMNYIPPSMPPPTSLNPQQQQQQPPAPVLNTEQSSTIQYPPSAPTVSDTEASAANSNAQQQQQQQQIQQQQMAAMMQMQQWNAAAAYAPPYMMGFPPGMMMMQPGMDRPASRQSSRPPSRQSVNAPVSSSRSLVNGQTGSQNQSSSLLPGQGYGNYMPPGMYNPWFDQYWQMMYAGYQNPYNFGYNDEMMKNYWKQGGYPTDDDRLSRHSAAVSQSKQSQHSSSIQTWGSRDSLNDEYYQMQNSYTNGYYPSKQPTMPNQVKRPTRGTTAPNTLLTTAGSANRQIPSTGPDAKPTFPSQNGGGGEEEDEDDDDDEDDDEDDDDEEEEESDDGSSDRFSIKSDLAQVNEDSSKALLAPLLYTRPHLRATFFFDQLVQVLPQSPSDTNQPAIVEIISANSVHSMAPSLIAERQLMSDFIGPLTSSTAKSNVIRYCERQSQLANKALHIIDRDALSILWQYMALLVKSNGLLDIRVDIPKILWSSSNNNNTQTIDESSANSNHTQTSSTATVENSLREFLALGEIDTSIKFACENQLFTHALIISYLTDRQLFEKTIHNIISNLDNGDVLKTFYELGAGSTPSVVTNVTKTHYGDWKRHLAVILANRTDTNAQFVDLCVKTMGDTLITSGRIYAGHFCYLIAGIPFGSYRNNADKIAVIGSIHAGQSNPSFASIPNLQLTEVYEYSIRKCLRNFIPLKIYYASKLVLHGLKREALAYCEEIGHSLIKEGNSAYVQLVDLQLFILIAEKSRAFSRNFQLDPTSYKEPTWLLELQRIIRSLTDNAFLNRTVRDESINSSYVQSQQQQPPQATNIPTSRVTNVPPPVEQPVVNIQPPAASYSSTTNATNGYDQISQSSSEQLTYQNQITNNYHNTLQVDTNVHYPTQVQPAYYEPPPQPPPSQQQQQQQQPAQAYYQSSTQSADTNNYSQQQQWAQQTTQSDLLNVSSQVAANNTSFYPTPSDQSSYIQPGFTSTPNPYASQQQQQQQPTQSWYPSGQNEQQENQTSSISEEPTQQPEQQQTNGQPKKKHAIFDDSDDVFPNANKTTDNKSNAKTTAPAANQDGAGAGGKTGFLGSLLGRVGFKRPAQAHLPDDKNRAFKFDEKTGRWIDTSKPADEQASSQLRPPPMMPSNNTSITGANNSAQSTAPPSFNPSMPPASSQPRTLSFAAGATTTTTTTTNNNHAVPPANAVTYPPQMNAPTQSAPLQPPTQTQLPQEQPQQQQQQQQQQKMPAKLSAAQQRLQEMRQQQAAALQNPAPPVASSNQFSLRNRPTQSRYVDVLASTKGAVAPTPNVALNDLMPTLSTGVPSFAPSNQPNNYFVPEIRLANDSTDAEVSWINSHVQYNNQQQTVMNNHHLDQKL